MSGAIKTTAASIKKFYRSMNEHVYISKDDYKDLCDIVLIYFQRIGVGIYDRREGKENFRTI